MTDDIEARLQALENRLQMVEEQSKKQRRVIGWLLGSYQPKINIKENLRKRDDMGALLGFDRPKKP